MSLRNQLLLSILSSSATSVSVGSKYSVTLAAPAIGHHHARPNAYSVARRHADLDRVVRLNANLDLYPPYRIELEQQLATRKFVVSDPNSFSR
jgi:hypothetical protein